MGKSSIFRCAVAVEIFGLGLSLFLNSTEWTEPVRLEFMESLQYLNMLLFTWPHLVSAPRNKNRLSPAAAALNFLLQHIHTREGREGGSEGSRRLGRESGD